MMMDGITVNGLHSYRDFGLYISKRVIGLPEKKSVRDTVPYMNGYWDFTTLLGPPTWGSRPLSYTFDIVENTIQGMDRARDAVVNWLLNAHETEIHDDSIPDYHFIGSYDDNDMSEDGEAAEFTVKFLCHPFKLANFETMLTLANGKSIIANEGQATRVFVSSTSSGTIELGGLTQSFAANTRTELGAMLNHGEIPVTVSCTDAVKFFYTEAII